MRREHADLAFGNLVLVLDEHRAESLEPADDVLVVDDLVAHVDRRPVLLEQPLDDLDRAVDAGAERARRREEDASAVHAIASAARCSARSARDAVAHRPDRGAAARGDPAREAGDVGAPVGMDGRVDAEDGARRRVRDGTQAAGETPGRREDPALHVDGVGAARLVQAAPLGRVGDEHVGREQRSRSRTRNTQRRAFPQRRAGRIDDARRVEDVADGEPVVQRACDAERDERTVVRNSRRAAHAHAHGAQARAARDALLRGRRAGEGQVAQPVSVHAMLRTVSFRLFDDSNAADGSKPEWMPQCSQRGSFPGP